MIITSPFFENEYYLELDQELNIIAANDLTTQTFDLKLPVPFVDVFLIPEINNPPSLKSHQTITTKHCNSKQEHTWIFFADGNKLLARCLPKTSRQTTDLEFLLQLKQNALEEISAAVAHELNNPLTVLQARLFMLQTAIEQKDLQPEKLKQTIEAMSGTIDKMIKTIKSVRSFAKDSTREPAVQIPVPLLIEECIEVCKTRFQNQGVTIKTHFDDPQSELECYPSLIKQSLFELMHNSYKNLQGHSERKIFLDVTSDFSQLYFKVKDTAENINPEIVQHFAPPFDHFAKNAQPPGLGLYHVYTAALKHHGQLKFDTHEKAFILILPRRQSK